MMNQSRLTADDSCISSQGCERCDRLPKLVQDSSNLHLWFPMVHSLNKVAHYLQGTGVSYELMQNGQGLSLFNSCIPMEQLMMELSAQLTHRELQETLALVVDGGIEPQLQDFSQIVPLHQLVKFSQSHWLLDMLAEKRVTTHFQPIVNLQYSLQSLILGYEALFRGFDRQGAPISPHQIFSLATLSGLLPQVDLLARLTAVQQAKAHQIQTKLFINFSPLAIYDPVACLRQTVQTIQAAGFRPEQIVFEITESDKPQDLKHLLTILRYYRDCGFLIALDDLGSGYSSLNLLHQIRPDFVKLDLDLVRDIHQDPYKALITEKILEIAQSLGIQTIAEGIERAEELHWMQSRGANYGQGYLLGRPSNPPVTEIPSFATLLL